MRAVSWVLLLVGLFLSRAPGLAADPPATFEAGKATLSLAVPDFPGLVRDPRDDEQLKGWWHGTVNGSDVEIELRIFGREDYWLFDPEDVTGHTEYVLRLPDYGGDPLFSFVGRELVKGAFGWVPFGSLAYGPTPNRAQAKGEVLSLGGILEEHAYAIRVRATPPLPEAERAQALAFLRKGVTVTGPVQSARWTDAEVKARWDKSTPDRKVRESLKDIIRTEHYVILTNSGAGALFAKKMEAYYDHIQKTYPFDEIEGRRLMPVFVFKSPEEYEAFSKHTTGMQDAETSKGHAFKDYYATYYDSPNDPVHIHEATHQIFKNRLHLDGGGSWFQEGVAEYICTKPGERKAYAKQAARSNDHCPFPIFMAAPRLISGTPPLDAHGAYLQAASIIEMLREGKDYAPKFQEFVHRVGALARGDLAGTEAIVKDLYGLHLEGLEKAWKKYWLAR